MDTTESEQEKGGDYTPAVSLEISSEIAEQAEELLSHFAEDAGLETALVVDRSGALVAGISSEAEVTVDVISALVAGASGAMRALVDELGETGEIESLHQGGNRLLYLRELVDRFVLVGVSDASLPAGIVREKARQVRGPLAGLLKDVKPAGPVSEKAAPKAKSLRVVAEERAAARNEKEGAREERREEVDPGEAEGFQDVVIEEDLPSTEESPPESSVPSDSAENSFEQAEGVVEPAGPEAKPEPEPEPEEPKEPKEPTGVMEPLDLGEPEIVIEGPPEFEGAASTPPAAVEAEMDGGKPDLPPSPVPEPVESIFELEDLVEIDEGDAGPEPASEEVAEEPPQAESAPEGVDKEEENEELEDEEKAADFLEEGEEGEEPVSEPEDEGSRQEEEEPEVKSSGPFYF